jgi:hypothetical protein
VICQRRMVPAPPLSQSLRSPSYSLPAVVLARDWATATIGMQVSFTPAWSGIGSFMAQLGQNHATVFGDLIGLDLRARSDTGTDRLQELMGRPGAQRFRMNLPPGNALNAARIYLLPADARSRTCFSRHFGPGPRI